MWKFLISKKHERAQKASMQQKNQTGKNNSITRSRHSFEIPRKKIPHDPQSLHHLMFPLPVFQSWIVHFQGFDYTLLCFQGTNFLYLSIQKKSSLHPSTIITSPCQVFSFLSMPEMKITCVSNISFLWEMPFAKIPSTELVWWPVKKQNLEVFFEVQLSVGLITCFGHLTCQQIILLSIYWLCLSGRETMERYSFDLVPHFEEGSPAVSFIFRNIKVWGGRLVCHFLDHITWHDRKVIIILFAKPGIKMCQLNMIFLKPLDPPF